MSPPVPKRRVLLSRPFAAVCVVGGLLGVAFGTALAASPDDDSHALTSTVFRLAFGGLAAITAVLRMRQTSTGRRRKAWMLFSVGLCLAVLANSIGLLLDVFELADYLDGRHDPHPGDEFLVDGLVVLARLACLIALTLFPTTARRGTDLTRLIMDGLVVGGSVLFLASVTVFPTLLAGRQSNPIADAQLLALPVLDLMIVTLATLMIARSGPGSRTMLRLLGAAFLLCGVSDMAYAVKVSVGAAPLGSWWDLGWMCGWMVLSLAALHPDAGIEPDPELPESSSMRSTMICFSVFLLAAAASMIVDLRGEFFLAPRVVWGLLILAVVMRQLALVVDNEQLRRSLEVRVLKRTKELREITTQRELLLASVADGIYVVDLDGRITMVNEATTRLLGRSGAQLLRADAHDLFHAPADDGSSHPREGCYIADATRSGLTTSGEDDVYLRGKGPSIDVEATASPLSGEHGITGAVVVFHDVSQRREMDRMKQKFISTISHELRTPLSSIRGALGLLAGGALGEIPPRAAKMVGIATSGSIRLGRLVNDILDIERLDSGMLPLTMEGHDMLVVCREAVTATTGMALAAGVSLKLGEVSGRVLADRDRLVQVLINLVGNAVRFSDPGDSVRLEAEQVGMWIQIAVSDSGRGIPDDMFDTIFGRFSQVDSSGTREKSGTGLGLAICRGLVEQMGGQIWVESELGKGSTFRFLLRADGDSDALGGPMLSVYG